MASEAQRIQESTLLRIIRANEQTEFGKQYNLNSIKSLEDFQKSMKLTDYSTYEPYHQRLFEKEEENLLSPQELNCFITTSGTTSSKVKYIPCYGARSAFRIPPVGSHMLFAHMHKKQNSPSGKPIMVGGSGQLPELLKQKPFPLQIPVGAYEIDDFSTALYVQLLFALKDKTFTSFICGYINFLQVCFQMLEKQWKTFCNDLKNGTISIDLSRWKENDHVNELHQLVGKNNEERVKELEEIFQNNPSCKGIVNEIWPELKMFNCFCGGLYLTFIDKIKFYVHSSVVFFSPVYVSIESLYGINKWPGRKIASFELMIPVVFFEFIPLEKEDKEENLLLIDQLEINQLYKLVITTQTGFYRYKLGDIIRVDEFSENGCPIISLFGRSNTLLGLYGEKVSEGEICNTIQSQWLNGSPNFWVSTEIKNGEGYYVFWIELGDENYDNDLSTSLDNYLGSNNNEYSNFRSSGKIKSLQVRFVKEGTVDVVQNFLSNRSGVALSNLKIMRLVNDLEVLSLLSDATVEHKF